MHNHQHSLAHQRQLTRKTENLLLINHVQTGSRLIEKEHRCLLRQNLCQQDTLLLTAGNLCHRLICQLPRTGIFHAVQRQTLIVLTFTLPPFKIGITARHNNILACITKANLYLLLQIGYLTRQISVGIFLHRLIKKQNLTALLRQHAANCFQKRTLAGTVAADDTNKLALTDSKAGIADNTAATVTYR